MAFEPKSPERRRGERVMIRIPVKVHAEGQGGEQVNEAAEAVVVSRYGALLRMQALLHVGTTLEVMNSFSGEMEKFKVVWVGERKEGKYELGIEFVSPREEFWGVRFPPSSRRS